MPAEGARDMSTYASTSMLTETRARFKSKRAESRRCDGRGAAGAGASADGCKGSAGSVGSAIAGADGLKSLRMAGFHVNGGVTPE